MKIGFVFTNYNNSKYTRDAIYSIYLNEFASESLIVVVDNKSNDKEIELLRSIKSEFLDINIIWNHENLGYFKGLNVGISYLRTYHKDICHMVVGNNDLIFQPGFIKSIFLQKPLFDKYPVVSPDIITLDGVHQNPHVIKKISKMRETIYNVYHSSYLIARLITFMAKKTKKITERKDRQEYENAQTICYGYGACYILGPLFFKHFDQLWAPTFLLGEESFLSRQIEEVNLKIFYEPKISAIHQEHATVSKVPKRQLWEFSRESRRVLRNHHKI
jgi:GT2 family glycosyltransferase